MNDSGLKMTEANAARVGVIMGAGIGGLDTIEETYAKYLETTSPRKISPFFIPGSDHQHGVRPHLDPLRPAGPEPRGRHGLYDVDARDRPRVRERSNTAMRTS